MRRCPALFVSGPSSNSGKTTVTAALARLYRGGGQTVRVLKTGPDFLDPMILEQASGAPVCNLDRQWAIMRRMIHSGADFDFNGLTRFHPGAVAAGVEAILAGRPLIADTEMICVGLSRPRLEHFGISPHRFIGDPDVSRWSGPVSPTTTPRFNPWRGDRSMTDDVQRDVMSAIKSNFAGSIRRDADAGTPVFPCRDRDAV